MESAPAPRRAGPRGACALRFPGCPSRERPRREEPRGPGREGVSPSDDANLCGRAGCRPGNASVPSFAVHVSKPAEAPASPTRTQSENLYMPQWVSPLPEALLPSWAAKGTPFTCLQLGDLKLIEQYRTWLGLGQKTQVITVGQDIYNGYVVLQHPQKTHFSPFYTQGN